MKICCYLVILVDYRENVCHGIHQHESAHVNFKEFLYFSLFSSVTSAALNTIQISYGISYFRQRDSSDIFTYSTNHIYLHRFSRLRFCVCI